MDEMDIVADILPSIIESTIGIGNKNGDDQHVNVLGTIYSGEFRNNEVEIEFKLSPSYKYTVNIANG